MQFKEFDIQESDRLVDLLTTEEWEFHSGPAITGADVRERIASGYFTGVGKRTFLILDGDESLVGFFRIFDLGKDELDGETPLFDIRLRRSERNKGIGKLAVEWLVNYVFTNYPNKNRIEATTRHDNLAMRKVLGGSGFVKEAHYRQCWPTRENIKVDTVGYGILRSDWESNTITPVNWTA